MFVDRRPRVGQIGSVASQRGMSSMKGGPLTHMPQLAVTMDIRRPSSTASVVDIAGDLTAACDDPLRDGYSQASDRDTCAVVLNFSGLEYMNSGIGLLVTLLVRANCQRQRLLA